jgi:ATP-dependent RNA helicase RhlE
LAGFKTQKIRVLVATDIAARGIDIPLLPHVINFELPNVPEDYVHRIGRTGRAGASGQALSLVDVDEIAYVKEIEKLLGEPLESEVVEGFEPTNNPTPNANKKQGNSRGQNRNSNHNRNKTRNNRNKSDRK